MSLDFNPRDKNTQADMLARHMPEGQVWENKFNTDSNLGKLILGLSCEYLRLSYLIENVVNEIDIKKTNNLINEWQESVGIPDSCIDGEGSLEEKRQDVILKINSYGGIQTAQDFVDLAELLGFTAVVSNGVKHGIFPLAFPIRFFDSRKTAVHTILVDLEEVREVFPITFPIPFTSNVTGLIQCLFKKLVPANCQVIFRYGVI